ncbi:DnaB-like helicase C-terminal domain-containing protein [Lentzea sp. CA-135723]|uniref:DnaB-like helicase C-terminal domain-containing protein n=1 Tax=Lentzea sp. CA-135723 TaxID=3239950 RepID=UPI003D9358E5
MPSLPSTKGLLTMAKTAAPAATTVLDVFAEAEEPVSRDTRRQELILLAMMLKTPLAMSREVLELPAGYFTGLRHQEVWEYLVERAEAGLDGDVPAVAWHLRDRPGAEEFVSQLADLSLSLLPGSPETLVEIIAEGHRHRLTEQVLTASYQRLRDGDVDKAIEILGSIDTSVGTIDRPSTLLDAWAQAQEEAELGLPVVPSPWPKLNAEHLGGGWRGRACYFFAGMPGAGKTVALQCIAADAAERERNVSMFSLEMVRSDLARRFLSTAARVPMSEMMRPKLDLLVETRDAVNKALARIGRRVHIHDPRLTASQLRAQARIDVRRHGCDLIGIDYVQLIKADDPRMPERERIEYVVGELDDMAKELCVPVVALVQPNRGAALAERKLQMTDMFGSGALERFGSMVVLLNKVVDEDEQGKPVATGLVDFDIDKCRFGPTGSVRMVADFGRQRFEEV